MILRLLPPLALGLAPENCMAKAGYGDFLAIATRPGVDTTRLYITWAYPESLRSRSGSTVYTRAPVRSCVYFFSCTPFSAITQSRRPRSSLCSGAPTSRILACAARILGEHRAQDRWLARERSRERSFHARRQHEVSSVRGQAMCEAAVAHLRRRTPSPTESARPCSDCRGTSLSF